MFLRERVIFVSIGLKRFFQLVFLLSQSGFNNLIHLLLGIALWSMTDELKPWTIGSKALVLSSWMFEPTFLCLIEAELGWILQLMQELDVFSALGN